MLKRIICSLLIVFMIFTLSTFSYGISQNVTFGNFSLAKIYYTPEDMSYWIRSVSPSTIEEIKVPQVANDNVEIKAICDNTKSRGVCQGYWNLKKVDLSQSKIEIIGGYCFKDCTQLSEFKNSPYLTEILGYAFQNANLNSITLNEGLEKIRLNAFEDAFSDENELYVINIPDSVKEIGENAFKVTNKKYRVVLVGKKNSIVEQYCETDSTCTFLERGDRIPTAEELLDEELRKEKSKLFENTEFTYGNYNNTSKADIINFFCLPASNLTSSNNEEYNDIIKVDDGIIVVGYSELYKYKSDSKYWKDMYLDKAKGSTDAIIIKYDYNLNTKWVKVFGGSAGDQFDQIYKMKDGGYLIFGRTSSTDKDLLNINNSTNDAIMAVKYDSNFNVLSIEMNAVLEKYKNEILEDNEGNISNGFIELKTILSDKMGPMLGTYVNERNTLITKYDIQGHKEWVKTFDRDSNFTLDTLTKAIEIDDGYVFIGTSLRNNSNSKLVEDAIIVKYNKPYDKIIIDGAIYAINVGSQKSADVFYIPWEDVTIGEMHWTSDNEDIATVDYKGNITAKKEGTTKIHLNVRGKEAEIFINVTDPNIKHIEEITLNKLNCTLKKGKSETLIATINPTDTTDSKTITWTSSNPNVATVDSTGLVTAVAEGTATITAMTSNEKLATCTINVTSPVVEVTDIILSTTTLNLKKGKSKAIEITIKPTTATNKEIEWTSSNTNVAIVSNVGIVTALSEGTSIITAKAKDGSEKIATCEVNVQKDESTNPGGTETEPINYLLGDVDENGKVDAQDAVMILKYVAHNITLNKKQLLAANTTKDKDGTVDAQDAVQILKYVAHNITSF